LPQEEHNLFLTDEQAMDWGIKLSKMEGLIPARKRACFAVLDEMKFKPEDIVVINLLVVATKI
jgi:tryptophan synthase beta chain